MSKGFLGHHHTEESKSKISKTLSGKCFSEEHKAKIGKAHKGRKHTIEARANMSNGQRNYFDNGGKSVMFGKHHSKESISRMREVKIGEKNGFYGKNHTKETLLRMSETKIGHEVTEETREKLRQANLGKHPTHETLAKMSKTHQELWQNSEFAKKMFKSQNRKPNKLELKLDLILQENFTNKWKYVGDGQLIIGGKCPDFANINGRKELIELFGNYWHQGHIPSERMSMFKKYGYDTLVIWESELKDEGILVQKIKDFEEKAASGTTAAVRIYGKEGRI